MISVKFAGYKINIQKPVAILYVKDKTSEKRKTIIPFTIASKGIKHIGIRLTKKVEALDNGNYKTLLKEIEET